MRKYIEEILWLAALIALFFMNTGNETKSLCLFRFAGVDSCPGCGLGHSIHHTLHLEFSKAFSEHLLGIPVTALLLYKITKPLFHFKNQPLYGYQTNAGNTAGNTN